MNTIKSIITILSEFADYGTDAIPIIDLNMPIPIIKRHLKIFMWNHFL